eukprot:6186454-Pleurochrysis_carterae.AAC.2
MRVVDTRGDNGAAEHVCDYESKRENGAALIEAYVVRTFLLSSKTIAVADKLPEEIFGCAAQTQYAAFGT